MNTKQKLDTCLLTVPGRWDETRGFLLVSEAAGALSDSVGFVLVRAATGTLADTLLVCCLSL